MPAVFRKTVEQDLHKPLKIQYCADTVFTKDNTGNLINVLLFEDGVPYNGGGTVSATAIRADGATESWAGTISGNTVSVALTRAALDVPGTLQVFIKVTAGTVETTVYAGVYNVVCTETPTVVAPVTPSDVAALIASIEAAIRNIPADWTSFLGTIAPTFEPDKADGYAAGAYVWYPGQPDNVGTLYRFTSAHSGTWTGTDATQVVIGNELNTLSNGLSAIDEISDVKTSANGSEITGWESGKNVTSSGNISGSSTFSASSTFIKLPEYVPTVKYSTGAYSGFVATYDKPDVSGFIERLSVSANSSININTNDVKYIRISVSSLNVTDANTLQWAWSYPLAEDLAGLAYYLTGDTSEAITIADNTDLDNLSTPGNYKVVSSSGAATIGHTPVTNAPYRIFVLQTTATGRIAQIAIVNQAKGISMYTRFYNGTTWSDWDKLVTDKESVLVPGLMATSSDYTNYFPNGSFNDAPQNTIIGLSANVPLTDGPIGDEWIGTPDREPGYIRGTLITIAYSKTSSGVTGLTQILIGYRRTEYKPSFSYRIAIYSGGAYVWSAWSKFEQDGYLHASNQIIYGGSLNKTISDLNDAEPNAIYQIDLNCDGSDEAHTVANHPCPGVSSVLMCYAFSYTTDHGRVQTLFNVRNECYYRYGYQAAEYRWTNWIKVASGTFMENKGRLANDTDLDTLFDNGYWLLGSNGGYGHDPLSGAAGFLTVKQINAVAQQTAERLSGARYIRYTTDSGTTWSEWHQT